MAPLLSPSYHHPIIRRFSIGIQSVWSIVVLKNVRRKVARMLARAEKGLSYSLAREKKAQKCFMFVSNEFYLFLARKVS